MSHLRESGSIEQDADSVWFLYASDERGVMNLDVAKNRHGPTDEIKLTWLPHITRFENHSPEVEEPYGYADVNIPEGMFDEDYA